MMVAFMATLEKEGYHDENWKCLMYDVVHFGNKLCASNPDMRNFNVCFRLQYVGIWLATS